MGLTLSIAKEAEIIPGLRYSLAATPLILDNCLKFSVLSLIQGVSSKWKFQLVLLSPEYSNTKKSVSFPSLLLLAVVVGGGGSGHCGLGSPREGLRAVGPLTVKHRPWRSQEEMEKESS